jgi:hypothetical protein
MSNYCFIASILPGGIELMKKWNEENIVNNKEYDALINIVFKLLCGLEYLTMVYLKYL